MRKFMLILAVLTLALTGCQATAQTPAEQYLASHSEAEIIAYFEQVTFIYHNFNNSSDLTSNELIDFATGGVCHNGPLDLESWYDEDSNSFMVPSAEIYDVLDKHFSSYQFKPEECSHYDYDAENDILIIPALGGGSAANYDLISAEALNTDNIKVIMLAYTDEETKYENPFYYCMTAKIVGENVHFTSYNNDYKID